MIYYFSSCISPVAVVNHRVPAVYYTIYYLGFMLLPCLLCVQNAMIIR